MPSHFSSSLLVFLMDWLLKVYVLQKVSNLAISKKALSLLVLGQTILYAIHPQYSLLLEPLIFLVWLVVIIKPNWKPGQLLYYSTLPYVLVEVSLRVTGAISAKYLVLTEQPDFFFNLISGLVAYGIILIVFFLFMKVMTVDFKVTNQMFYHPKFSRLMKILIAGLLVYVLILNPILVFSGEEQAVMLDFKTENIELSIDLLMTYLIFYVAGVIYLNYKSKDLMAQELQAAKDRQLASLSAYSQHVEALYGELRSFRHDYANILVSLNLAIEDGDMARVREIYQAVIADSAKPFQDGKYDIAKLANLQNDAMKGILSAKLMAAQNQGVEVAVEIAEPITAPEMDLMEIIQILSIFLDNAIEATILAEQPALSVAYFQEGTRKVLVVENTTDQERTDTRTIFRPGKSSKGKGRGIGLANVRAILSKYPNISLNTNSYNYRFSQVLSFDESPKAKN